MPRTYIPFRCPPEMVSELNKAAARRDISRNAFILRALGRVLEGEKRS